jgi:hypothetical protein
MIFDPPSRGGLNEEMTSELELAEGHITEA